MAWKQAGFIVSASNLVELSNCNVRLKATGSGLSRITFGHRNPSSLLSDAIQTLLPLEKKTRLVQDSVACSTVVTAMLDLIFKANEWKKLSETVTMIAKRRSALQKVIYKMVLQAMTYIKDVPNQEIEIELIEALRKVVAGKIFVELEEARLARMLAEIKEKQAECCWLPDQLVPSQ